MALGIRLQDPAFVGVDGREFLEDRQVLIGRGFLAVDRVNGRELEAAGASPDFAVDDHAIPQAIIAGHVRRDEGVAVGLIEVAVGLAQKAKAFRAEFHKSSALAGWSQFDFLSRGPLEVFIIRSFFARRTVALATTLAPAPPGRPLILLTIRRVALPVATATAFRFSR